MLLVSSALSQQQGVAKGETITDYSQPKPAWANGTMGQECDPASPWPWLGSIAESTPLKKESVGRGATWLT